MSVLVFSLVCSVKLTVIIQQGNVLKWNGKKNKDLAIQEQSDKPREEGN